MEKKKEGKKEKNEDHQRGGGLTGVVVAVVVVVKGEAASVRTAQGGRNQCQQAICGQLTREGEEGGGGREDGVPTVGTPRETGEIPDRRTQLSERGKEE